LPFARERGRRLRLRRSPRRSHAPGQPRLRVIGPVKNGGSQNGPSHRSANENRNDRRNPFQHAGLCLDSLRQTPTYLAWLVLSSTFHCKVQAGARFCFAPCRDGLRSALSTPYSHRATQGRHSERSKESLFTSFCSSSAFKSELSARRIGTCRGTPSCARLTGIRSWHSGTGMCRL